MRTHGLKLKKWVTSTSTSARRRRRTTTSTNSLRVLMRSPPSTKKCLFFLFSFSLLFLLLLFLSSLSSARRKWSLESGRHNAVQCVFNWHCWGYFTTAAITITVAIVIVLVVVIFVVVVVNFVFSLFFLVTHSRCVLFFFGFTVLGLCWNLMLTFASSASRRGASS